MDIVLKTLLILLLCYLCLEDIQKKEISNLGNLLFLLLSIAYMLYSGENIERILVFLSIYILPLILMYGYLSDFLQKEVLGFGDIKFIMGIGVLMSSHSLWLSLYYFYLISFCLAAIMGVLWYGLKKEKEIPMLPAFCFGFFAVKVFL